MFQGRSHRLRIVAAVIVVPGAVALVRPAGLSEAAARPSAPPAWAPPIRTLAAEPAAAGLPAQESPAAELRRLEAVWNEAHLEGDAEALDRLWADELVVSVPKMPVMTKADVIGVWRSGGMRFERYRTSDVRVRVYGAAAVVTGRLRRTRHFRGHLLDDDWRFTKVYVRRGGDWRVVAFHASEAPAP